MERVYMAGTGFKADAWRRRKFHRLRRFATRPVWFEPRKIPGAGQRWRHTQGEAHGINVFEKLENRDVIPEKNSQRFIRDRQDKFTHRSRIDKSVRDDIL